MTERTSRIQKYTLCFQKISIFGDNYDFIEKIIWKKVNFFSCDFKIFDGTIRCAAQFYASVIAIDLVKIFKQNRNHLAHF